MFVNFLKPMLIIFVNFEMQIKRYAPLSLYWTRRPTPNSWAVHTKWRGRPTPNSWAVHIKGRGRPTPNSWAVHTKGRGRPKPKRWRVRYQSKRRRTQAFGRRNNSKYPQWGIATSATANYDRFSKSESVTSDFIIIR